MYPTTTVTEAQRLAKSFARHTCTITLPGSGAPSYDEEGSPIPPTAGTVYDGACHVTEDRAQIVRMAGGDESYDANGMIRLTSILSPFNQEDATVTARYLGRERTGRIVDVIHRELATYVTVRWDGRGSAT